MGKWADLATNLKRRDAQQIEDMTNFYGDCQTIENRIALAEGLAH
jgi:hypothetical protein